MTIVPLGLNSLWGYGYAMAFNQTKPLNGAIFGAASHIVHEIANWVFKKLNFGDTSTALLTSAVACWSGYGLLTQILSEPITPAGVIKTYLGMEGTKILALFLYCFLKSVLTAKKSP